MRRLAVVLAAIVLAGCRTGTLPNPNDPSDVGPVPVETLRKNLKATSDVLNVRQEKGLITEDGYRKSIKRAAEELLKDNLPPRIDEDEAWQYAELFAAAQRWNDAKALLERAVRYAKAAHNEDRWVNDDLRLARAEAELGQVKAAIAAARDAQNASNTGSAPVLPGTLLEIVPAARAKGQDLDLAILLEGAIGCHMRTIVDPTNDAGKAFLFARPHHVRKAWETVVDLYRAAGRPGLAREAAKRGEKMLASMAQA